MSFIERNQGQTRSQLDDCARQLRLQLDVPSLRSTGTASYRMLTATHARESMSHSTCHMMHAACCVDHGLHRKALGAWRIVYGAEAMRQLLLHASCPHTPCARVYTTASATVTFEHACTQACLSCEDKQAVANEPMPDLRETFRLPRLVMSSENHTATGNTAVQQHPA